MKKWCRIIIKNVQKLQHGPISLRKWYIFDTRPIPPQPFRQPLPIPPQIRCFRPASPTLMQLFLGPYLSIWYWVLEKSAVPRVFQSFHPKWPVYSEIRLASLSGAARSLEPSFLSGVCNVSCSLSQSRRLIIPSIQTWIHTNSRISRALLLLSSSSSLHKNRNHFPTLKGRWFLLFIF